MKKEFILFILILLAIHAVWANKAIETDHYEIVSQDLHEAFSGLRIVHLSDLHNEEFGKGNEKLLTKITEISPDIIVITGDIIDSRRTDTAVVFDFVKEAVKIAPVYYANGNHESRINEYDFLFDEIERLGATILIDKFVTLQRGDDCINITGISDPTFINGWSTMSDAEIGENMRNRIEKLSGDGFNILLSHRPEYFDVYASCGVNLVFTGHAHGGQFRLPFIGGLYSPGQGLFPEYDSGLYTKDDTNMIVNRGLGNSLFPLRINNRPEIISVELVCK